MSAAEINCAVPAETILSMVERFEEKNGVGANAHAAKHLSELLMIELSRVLVGKESEHYVQVTFAKDRIESLQWLAGEVWGLNLDLCRLLDDVGDQLADLSHSVSEAKKPEVKGARHAA